jgi:hypothetical protein
MRCRFVLGMLCGGLVVATAIGAVAGSDKAQPGSEPFMPTRLEWALVEFNARVTGDLGARYGVSVSCTRPKPPSTLVCPIHRQPEAKQADVEAMARAAKSAFDLYKKERGFGWLNVEFSMPETTLRSRLP